MKKLLHYMLFVSLLSLASNCRTEAKKENGGITIDFDARIPETESVEDANKSIVLLRIKLMNTKEDLIKYGLSTSQEQRKRQEYYILNFTRDIYLISGVDTISCIDSHMEQLYMDLPYRTFILNFGEHAVKEKDKLLILDKVFSNNALLVSINKNL